MTNEELLSIKYPITLKSKTSPLTVNFTSKGTGTVLVPNKYWNIGDVVEAFDMKSFTKINNK